MLFIYDVDFHFCSGDWDTYSVQSDCIAHAVYKAICLLKDEVPTRLCDCSIDMIKVFKGGTDKLLKVYNIKECL